ncbi:vesicular glutamate transporter 1-like [Tubulanus polymorphus]|uniref:vesicular glutamate transporter 1-like n=1 Tax=Tubulanus polymorphus TaxID=672921 RepID=UPI003DA28EA8
MVYQTQDGLILSSVYWGYLITSVPAGVIVTKYGGCIIFGTTTAVSAVATLLIPIATTVSPYLVIALQVIIGLCQGVAYPAGFSLWASWAPPSERSRLTTISFAGVQIGSVATLLVSGLFCEYFGWPSIFYTFGGLSCVWCVCWYIIAYDSPEEHPRISAGEKKHIQDSQSGQIEKTNKLNLEDVPWYRILTSRPVWGLHIAKFCFVWLNNTFLMTGPSYINEVFKLDIKTNGAFSAFCNGMMWLVLVISGISADFLIKRFPDKITVIRKTYFSTGEK